MIKTVLFFTTIVINLFAFTVYSQSQVIMHNKTTYVNEKKVEEKALIILKNGRYMDGNIIGWMPDSVIRFAEAYGDTFIFSKDEYEIFDERVSKIDTKLKEKEELEKTKPLARFKYGDKVILELMNGKLKRGKVVGKSKNSSVTIEHHGHHKYYYDWSSETVYPDDQTFSNILPIEDTIKRFNYRGQVKFLLTMAFSGNWGGKLDTRGTYYHTPNYWNGYGINNLSGLFGYGALGIKGKHIGFGTLIGYLNLSYSVERGQTFLHTVTSERVVLGQFLSVRYSYRRNVSLGFSVAAGITSMTNISGEGYGDGINDDEPELKRNTGFLINPSVFEISFRSGYRAKYNNYKFAERFGAKYNVALNKAYIKENPTLFNIGLGFLYATEVLGERTGVIYFNLKLQLYLF